MASETGIWTRACVIELWDDGQRHELVDGEHLVTPAPTPSHQFVAAELFRRLDAFVRRHGFGTLLFPPADINLTGSEILQPDLFIVPRLVPGHSWSDIGRLLIAIEILSPSSARYDRGIKRMRYQRGGVDEYWIVDIDARLIERWRPDNQRPEIATEKLIWHPAEATDPLTIDVPAMFAGGLGDQYQ